MRGNMSCVVAVLFRGTTVASSGRVLARTATLLAISTLVGCYGSTQLLPPDHAGLRAANGSRVQVEEGDDLVLDLRSGEELRLAGPVRARLAGSDAIFDSPVGRSTLHIADVETATLRRRSVATTVIAVAGVSM